MIRSTTLLIGWLVVFGLTPLGRTQEGGLPIGEVIDKVTCVKVPEKSYSLYIPPGYDPNRAWPLLLLFDPGARSRIPMEIFQEAAENFGFIMACSRDTRNYTTFEESWVSIHAMWTDLLKRFPIDKKRMYTGGMSGGARLASRVAMHTELVEGLIACGAGLWVRTRQAPPPTFEVVSTVGEIDFNFLELVDLQKELTGNMLANRRLIFEGEHRWPDPALAYEAVGWLQLRAFRKKRIPLEQVRVADQVSRRLAAAKDHDNRGKLLIAQDKYRHLLNDFQDLTDLGEVEKRISEINASKDFKTLEKAQSKAEQRERKLRDQYVARLQEAEARSGGRNWIRKEILWWKKELGSLNRRRAKTQGSAEANGAQRLFFMLRTHFYERSVYLFQDKQYEKSIFTNTLATILMPEKPWPHFFMACAFAQTGDPDSAIQALEECVGKGFKRKDKILEEPLLEPIRSDPRFQAVLDKIQNP